MDTIILMGVTCHWPECKIFLEHDASQNNFHLGNPWANRPGRHQVHEAGAEQNQQDGQTDPGHELEVDILHKVLDEPVTGVAAHGNGGVHDEADHRHDDPQHCQEHPVLPYPSEGVAPQPGEGGVNLSNQRAS